MEQKSNRFVIYPLVTLPMQNWQYSLSDETLIGIWKKIEEEEKVDKLFYDGSIRDIQGWLNFIKGNNVFFIIVWDSINKKIVHIAWLKDTFDYCAWIHHCSIGKYQRGVWEAVKSHWQKSSLKLLLGLTPIANKPAVKMLRIAGFKIVGEIPWVCNMAYLGERVPGIISYFEL